MKLVNTIAVFALTGTILLSGCSTNSNHSTTPKQNTSSHNTSSVTTVKDGVSKLLETTNELKQALDTNNEAKIKEVGPKLETIWKSFEDEVKPKYPDLYEEIEKSLNPEVAGIQISPIDTKMLGKLNAQLIETLRKLKQKVN